MTENERIKKHIEDCEHRIGNILGFMESNSDADIFSCEENIVVLKEVIIALEEIQQYRAIGTVEELKIIEESFNVISDKVWNYILAGEELLERYEAIGTIEEFKDLKEKDVPRKPIRKPNHNWTNEEITCPNCGRNVSEYASKYCNCGQKLNWQ